MYGSNSHTLETETILEDDEYVDQVTAIKGSILDGLKFYTQNGGYIGLHGRDTAEHVTVDKKGFAFMTGKYCTNWWGGADAICNVNLNFLYSLQ